MKGRFVIQIHSGYGPLHYDFMLERGEALATWQVAVDPQQLQPGRTVAARKLPDHRLAYLSYEGSVSRNRGQVAILDRGEYEALAASETRWEIRLDGEKIQARFELVRGHASGENWTLARLEENH